MDESKAEVDMGLGGRVLVVEDNPVIGQFITTALREEGCEVMTTWNGADALEEIRSFRPDLIVLDMWLPIMQGQTFLEIHRQSRESQAPVIAITASSNLAEKAKELGAAEVFHKPFDLNEFLEAANKYLSARQR
jgi:DNA-binding response OmpR family regulator